MAAELHISISAERVASFGPLNISNSILTSLIVSALMIVFFLLVNKSLNPKAKRLKPLQNIAEFIIQGFYGLVQSVTGDHKKTRFFMPYFTAFFLFIMFNNWFGLLPGVGTIGFKESAEGIEHAVLMQKEIDAPIETVQAATLVQEDHADETEAVILKEGEAVVEPVEIGEEEGEAAAHEDEGVFVPYLRAGTADLNTTIALSLFTMVFVQVVGVKYLGLAYFKKFINFKNPIMMFVAVLETISEFAKVISFSFRLFGNIFAGEVLLIVIGALVPLIVPMPFYGLEIFVGFIQALVFSLLSVVFYNVATVSHDDH
jgi:F-type H+-transporting ATPase subunit a